MDWFLYDNGLRHERANICRKIILGDFKNNHPSYALCNTVKNVKLRGIKMYVKKSFDIRVHHWHANQIKELWPVSKEYLHWSSNCLAIFLKINFSMISRSSRSHMFFKIDVLKNVTIFAGKHLPWSLFFVKLQPLRYATLLKRYSNTDVFVWMLRNFQEQLFL